MTKKKTPSSTKHLSQVMKEVRQGREALEKAKNDYLLSTRAEVERALEELHEKVHLWYDRETKELGKCATRLNKKRATLTELSDVLAEESAGAGSRSGGAEASAEDHEQDGDDE